MGGEGERKEIWTRGDGSWAQVEWLASKNHRQFID